MGTSVGDKVISVAVEKYFWQIVHFFWIETDFPYFSYKILQKYSSPVTEITLSPGWISLIIYWITLDCLVL